MTRMKRRLSAVAGTFGKFENIFSSFLDTFKFKGYSEHSPFARAVQTFPKQIEAGRPIAKLET